MTENEVVTYLKENRTKGTVFAFMPEEVRKWCIKHRDERIFYIVDEGEWIADAPPVMCHPDSTYCLDVDYEPEPEFKPHWEEFPINKDGMFFITTDDGKIHRHRWWDWMTFLNRHRDNFDDFGGWVYEMSLFGGGKAEVLATSPHFLDDDEELSSYIRLNNKDKVKPAYPTKILFWRYKE